MIKLIGLTFLVINLTGCVVADMDSSNYTSVHYAQTFQKKGKEGQTDKAIRKADLYSCGVDKNQNLDDDSWSKGATKKGENFQQTIKRVESVESCMKNKGYVIYSFRQCGPLKAPTGLCN